MRGLRLSLLILLQLTREKILELMNNESGKAYNESNLQNSCPQTVDTIGKRDEMMYDVLRPNDITWNFEKFLVDRNGKVRFRFHPTAWSKGETVQKYIEQILSEKA